MLYEYDPKSLSKELEDEKYLKKKYGVAISEGMSRFLERLDDVNNIYEIFVYKSFMMEHLK